MKLTYESAEDALDRLLEFTTETEDDYDSFIDVQIVRQVLAEQEAEIARLRGGEK